MIFEYYKNSMYIYRENLMKKILTYFAYFGAEDVDEKTFIQRYLIISKQLSYIHELEKTYPFDRKYIVSTIPSRHDIFLEHLSQKYGYQIVREYISRENTFEYPGFAAMNQLSSTMSDDKDILFYFHSKGVGILEDAWLSSTFFEINVHALMACDIEKIFESSKILRVGLFPSEYGWMWHNFFAVRPSIMGKPVFIDGCRYAYESFIGNCSNPLEYLSSYSLLPERFPNADFVIRPFYTPENLSRDILFKLSLRD